MVRVLFVCLENICKSPMAEILSIIISIMYFIKNKNKYEYA